MATARLNTKVVEPERVIPAVLESVVTLTLSIEEAAQVHAIFGRVSFDDAAGDLYSVLDNVKSVRDVSDKIRVTDGSNTPYLLLRIKDK